MTPPTHKPHPRRIVFLRVVPFWVNVFVIVNPHAAEDAAEPTFLAEPPSTAAGGRRARPYLLTSRPTVRLSGNTTVRRKVSRPAHATVKDAFWQGTTFARVLNPSAHHGSSSTTNTSCWSGTMKAFMIPPGLPVLANSLSCRQRVFDDAGEPAGLLLPCDSRIPGLALVRTRRPQTNATAALQTSSKTG
jgi:hypothetical protein